MPRTALLNDTARAWLASADIEAQNLARRYGRRWALADVSFNLAGGAVLMVAGPNGSGKSTLLRTIATAIRPDGGSARVGGFDVVTRARGRPQARRAAQPCLVSLRVAHRAREPRPSSPTTSAALATASPRCSIASRLGRRADDVVATFSAGMRKRLSFARVLLQEPRVALLDEPYGQLDPEGFELVDDVVRELKAGGTTVMIATHQIERAAASPTRRSCSKRAGGVAGEGVGGGG